MSRWATHDERVFALPSGRLIRGRGLGAHPHLSPDPDFGLYLFATPVTDVTWAHERIDWPDFGLPTDPAAADRAMVDAWRRANDERVEVACMGGHGRTGTALSCLTVLDGLAADAAISYVRTHYDPAAVETPEQADYVSQFAARRARSAGRRVVRAGAYAVCVHDGRILLSHQVSPGPAQGKWTLPGGGIWFGEEPSAAAVRECEEETGLVPTLGHIVGVHSGTYPAGDGSERHGIRILYAASFPGGAPTPTSPDDGEIDQVGWFPLDALPSPVTEWATLGVELVGAARRFDTPPPLRSPGGSTTTSAGGSTTTSPGGSTITSAASPARHDAVRRA